MEKRTVIIGGYDTAVKGWTLNVCQLADAEQKTNFIEKAGGDGSWNLSTAMTGGLPRYRDRALVIRLECSEGTRSDRTMLISEMVNQLDGLTWDIVLPDHPGYYVRGQARIMVEYHDLAHSAVTIECVCEPWIYKAEETIVHLTLTTEERTATLINNGRRALVPLLTLEGGGNALLEYGTASLALDTDGSYEWPTLLLTTGAHVITYSGTGSLVITYREAVLR